jgi:hypothetical protein
MSPPSLRGGPPPREVEDIVLANSIRRPQGRHLLVAANGRAKEWPVKTKKISGITLGYNSTCHIPI